MDLSRHSIKKYTVGEKTHAAINKKTFKKLGLINDQLYAVEFAKSEVDQNEPIIVGFFTLQYASLRMLEFLYNFNEFCVTDKYEEIETVTDLLSLTLAEKKRMTACEVVKASVGVVS